MSLTGLLPSGDEAPSWEACSAADEKKTKMYFVHGRMCVVGSTAPCVQRIRDAFTRLPDSHIQKPLWLCMVGLSTRRFKSR